MSARFTKNLRHRLTAVTGCALLAAVPSQVWADDGLSPAAAPHQTAPSADTTGASAGATDGAPEPGEVLAQAGETTPSPMLSLRSLPLPPPAPRLFAITPERRALLNTIRYAEGTWANGDDIGYWIMFGGGLMPHLERHPDRVVRSRRYASAAAGAYQFMPFTWRMVSQALGIERFGPQVQDQAAIFLIQRRGALALADQGRFTPQLAHQLAPEWASFPTLAGSSFYGQPVKRFQDLQRFYEQNLAQLRAGVAPDPFAAAKPACEPSDLRCRLEALDRPGRRGLAS